MTEPVAESRGRAIGPGAVLDSRYVIDAVLASGGMGVMFRGTDLLLDRPVAVKVLHSYLAAEDDAARFLHEGQLLASLTHPNLARIYDMDSAGGTPYLVMEFVEGESLAEIIEREAPLASGRGIALALQVCHGLGYMHERGVIHRDIKPQNLLLMGNGRVKIVDFGVARGPAAMEITVPGSVLGTAHYLAPELVRGDAATAQSDLYALGVVLYRLFTGRLPFEGDNPLEVAMLHRTAPVPRPCDLVPEMPSALQEVLLRLLEKEPAQRYPSAGAAAAALRGVTPQP